MGILTSSHKWREMVTVLVLAVVLAGQMAVGRGAVIEVTTLTDVIDSGVCGSIMLADLPGPDGYVSLREAMCVANNEPGEHTIRFRDGLTDTLTLTATLPSPEKALTIIGGGQDGPILDGVNSHRIFDFPSALAPVTLVGLHLTRGNSTGPDGGGAIRHAGDLTLINCRVSASTSEGSGGGIHNQGGDTLRLENCLIDNNTVTGAAFGGGGVASMSGGPVIAIHTKFERNEALGTTLAYGGGLFAQSRVELHECEFAQNAAYHGGGGLFHTSSSDPEQSLTIVNSTIHTNTAIGSANGQGGGLFLGGPASLVNTTIFGNSSNSHGGGILVETSETTLINCTVTQNYSNVDLLGGGDGGGVAQNFGTLELLNTLIANNNSFNADRPDISGTITSQGHNLIGNVGTTNFSSNTTGDIYGDPMNTTTPNAGAMEHSVAVDPLIAPIQSNGGPVPTAALMPNSPAVNAGNSAFIAPPFFNAPPYTDARGTGFARIIGEAVDIGAFESDGETIPIIYFNSIQDIYNYRYFGVQELSLREAIALAPSGAIIEFDRSAMGLFTPISINIGSSISEFLISRDLIIRGPGTNILVINAESMRRIMTISGNAQAEISGIGFRNGLVTGDGGAIRMIDSASLTLKDCDIFNCRATTDGGGISNKGSGALTVVDSLIEDCRATGSGSDGGGISNEGTGAPLTIIRSTIRNCLTSGGGMGSSGAGVNHLANGGLLTIRDSVIALNQANGLGGGVFCQFGDIVISGSAIYGNAALQANFGGGGLYLGEPCVATITNSTISGNSARDFGGGIHTGGDGVNLTLTNVTIAHNISDSDSNGTGAGGGIYQLAGTLHLRNTLIAANVDNASQTPDITYSGFIISGGHNLISNVGASNFDANIAGDRYGDPFGTTDPSPGAFESPTPIDAMLSPLQNNGGHSPTHALMFGSPAIDAGNNEFITSPLFGGPPFTDQRGEGFARFLDGNADSEPVVDIGAFESLGYSLPIIVSSLADGNDGNFLPGFLTLREAIALAPAIGYINFEPSLDGTITVNSQLVIAKNLTVNGPGADMIKIRGVGNVRCVFIDSGFSVIINKLQIENGNSSQGGGIHNRGSLLLNECAFVENQSSTFGGAIYNRGSMTIVNSYFEGNQTNGDSSNSGGGAIANYDIGSGASLFVQNSTFYNNVANNSLGGAVFNFGDGAGNNASLFLINCTISECHAGAGGGVYNSGSDTIVTVNHSTIVKCSALGGPGLFNETGAGSVTLMNSLFGDNSALSGGDVNSINVTANYCLFEIPSTTVAGDNNIIGMDPQILPLANNGGYWPTHAVQRESPAVDAANTDDSLSFDARYMARPIDGDVNGITAPDIGAFEFAPYLFVAGDTGVDARSGSAWLDDGGLHGPVRSIERALEMATYGTEIWIKRGSYQPVGFHRVGAALASTYAPIILKSGVALRGGFEGSEAPGGTLPPFDPSLTIIDASVAFDGEPGWHVMAIVDTEDVGIYDVTLTGGAANGHVLLNGSVGGGVIVLNSTTSRGLNNCVVRGNRAEQFGGGVAIGANCVFPIINCMITDNVVDASGAGGIGVFNADVDILGTTISGNTAVMGNGGGLLSRRGRITITNSTISGNTAGRHGGGVFAHEAPADVKFNFVTITNNTAGTGGDHGSGGGVWFDHVGMLSLGNSIIAGNKGMSGQAPDLAASGATSMGYNLIGDLGYAGFDNNSIGDQYGDTQDTATPAAGALETNGVINPMLSVLGDFGGPTWTHVPFAGSPVIDAADPAAMLDVDQRGEPRPFDGGVGGLRSDIGAVEQQSADNYSPSTYYYIY